MVKAVQVHTVGGRHRLKVEEVELARPGCLEVEVRHTAIGLNYLDVQDCKGGHYHSTHHPSVFTPGRSAVGIITELGTGVLNHKIGDRVGYVHAPSKYEKSGAFSEANILPTSHLIPLPSTITDEEAAALLFPGLTSWMLFKKFRPSNGRAFILVHGAGTGLGTILTQIAKHMKATVIGTVDSEEEVGAANGRGCDEAIDVSDGSGWGDGVWEMSDCKGVDVVIDLVGLSDFEDVLNLLAPKGTLVCLGNQTPVLNFKQLAEHKSVIVGVPVLADYVSNQADLAEGAQFLFDIYKAGAIKVEIARKIPLNMINEALDAPGLCILIPPIPDPKCVPDGS